MELTSEFIFEAVLDDDVVAALPKLIATHLSARSCTLHWRDGGHGREIFGHSGYFTDEQLTEYASNFADVDLWTLAGLERPNQSWLCSDLVDETEYRSSRFYNDWIRAMGDDTYHCMGSVMSAPAGFGIIGVHRGRTQNDFDSNQVQRLAAVVPDLQRMFAARIRLHKAENEVRDMQTLIAALPDALFVVDNSAHILITNSAADQLLSQGRLVHAVGGKLQAAGPQAAMFRELVARATASTSASGADCMLQNAVGTAMVSAVPLTGHAGSSRALITICLRKGVEDKVRVRNALRQVFALSTAEAEIALHIREGYSLRDIAEKRAVSLGTVRNQVKMIMWKMGVNRQSQIVASVVSIGS